MMARLAETLNAHPLVCSIPLPDADLSLDNCNWTKGLQSMADWIWAGNMIPTPFPNNLARYFVQVPAILEQQLNYSTTLIFDEPSYRNGIQVSGFLDRVARELVINLIAQRRRVPYTMTHHATLGLLTARKHGLSDEAFAAKYCALFERDRPGVFTPVERAMLDFAEAFATNPKAYTEQQFLELKAALRARNEARYPNDGRFMNRLTAARAALARGLAAESPPFQVMQAARAAADGVSEKMSDEAMDRMLNAQVVELGFLCLQFVALGDMFTALQIPDEPGTASFLEGLLPAAMQDRLADLIEEGLPPELSDGTGLLPPPLIPELPLAAVLERKVSVGRAALKKKEKRIPQVSYEQRAAEVQLDKGITIGGAQVAVFGWSFGLHFPGALVYCLMHHPEMARYESNYSLPLLFNEDEWRNGVQTGGYVSRLEKELAIQKIYQTLRSRYGLEHHTMYFYNSYLDEYGVGRYPTVDYSEEDRGTARQRALDRAEAAVLHMMDHRSAPEGVFTPLEKALLDWTETIIRRPHAAREAEAAYRAARGVQNRWEIEAGLRRLDTSPGIGREAALSRLLDHQVAEQAMVVGHMDGLGRLLTMLQLETEDAAQIIPGELLPDGRIRPELDADHCVRPTGAFNNRPSLEGILRLIGVSDRVLTHNELLLNPELNTKVCRQLAGGRFSKPISVSADEALATAEF